MYMTDFDEIRNLLDKSRSKDLDFKETLIKRTTEFVEELLLESIKSSLQDNVRNLVFGVEIHDIDYLGEKDKNKLDLTNMFCQRFEMNQGTNLGIIKYSTINKILTDALNKLGAKFSISLGKYGLNSGTLTLTQPVRCRGDWEDASVIIPESIKIKHPFIPFRLHAMSTNLVQANILSGPYFQLSGKFLTRYGRDVGDYWEGKPIDYTHDNGYKTNDEGDPYSYACNSYGVVFRTQSIFTAGMQGGNHMIIAVVQFP